MRIGLTSSFVDDQDQAERFKALGVVFVKEPGRMAYGGMDAVFAHSCGNLLNLPPGLTGKP